MQTAENPQERLQLSQVAAEPSIAEAYNVVAAEDTAAAAGRVHLRRAFLLRAEEAERKHVTAVSADLRRVDEDIKQVCTAALCLILSSSS